MSQKLLSQIDYEQYRDLSNIEEIQQMEQQLREKILGQKKIKRQNRKVVVGSGFTFDMTQFFKFEKPKYML